MRRIANGEMDQGGQTWNEDEEDSQWRDGSRRTDSSDEARNDLLKSMRKEMDELKNAMKEKTNRNLDGMVKRTDSSFMAKVLECPFPPKFHFP